VSAEARRRFRATRATIDDYIEKRLAEKKQRGGGDVTAATVNRELAVLRKAFNLAKEATPPKVGFVPKFSWGPRLYDARGNQIEWPGRPMVPVKTGRPIRFFRKEGRIVETTTGDRGGKGTKMSEYHIDLDPKDSVLRLTITAEIMTLECAQEIHKRLSQISANGGPYAAIYDLSLVKSTTIPTDTVRTLARNRPSIPAGRPHVIVGEAPVIFGLARLFQMCGEAVNKENEVVHTLEEAYEIVKARPEDFTQRL
jgi:hypothetical protein